VLTLSAIALLDTDTIGSTLGTSIAYILYKEDTTTYASAIIAIVSNLDTIALYKYYKLVALVAYNLSDLEADINVKI
jgi:hypothetical protein